MASSNTVRIELLNKENYDTWKIQMQALLIKSEAWAYVSGQKSKSEATQHNEEDLRRWVIEDEKAKADIILLIKLSQLKAIKECRTSRELWLKLQSIYQSSGPARKATLIKQLTYHRMQEGDDVREYIQKFFDIVDKLNETDVDINNDLLSVMLLHSLPPSFGNFRCAIESRDILPSPESLRIKIVEESDAREHGREDNSDALFTKRQQNKKQGFNHRNNQEKKRDNKTQNDTKKEIFSYKCHRCRKTGHRAAECTERIKNTDDANAAENLSLCATASYSSTNKASIANISKDVSHRIWCMDSGCTAHMCGNDEVFVNFNESTSGKVNLANKVSTDIKGKGSVSLITNLDGKTKNVDIKDTLYVPELRTNLLSVGKICDKGFSVIFKSDSATVMDKNRKTVLKADRTDGGLYYLRTTNIKDSANAVWNDDTNMELSSAEIWHRKMGHLNYRDLMKCYKENAVRGMRIKDFEVNVPCKICTSGKMVKTSFPKKSTRKSEILEIVHSDICGPMRTESIGKSKYFITFIDDALRWCEIRFLKRKNEAFQAFKEYKAFVENQTGKRVKFLQFDNGKEFRNDQFDTFLKENRIGRRLTISHTPEQNGIAEREEESDTSGHCSLSHDAIIVTRLSLGRSCEYS